MHSPSLSSTASTSTSSSSSSSSSKPLPLRLSTKCIGIGLSGFSGFNGLIVIAFIVITTTLGNAQEFTTIKAPSVAELTDTETATDTGSNFNIPTLLNIDGLLAFPNAEQSSSLSNGGDSSNDNNNINNNNAKVETVENVETVVFSAIDDSQVTPCSLSDPNQNECIRGLFNEILPKLKDGLPDFGMESIDPYFYRRGIFRYANDGIQGGLLVRNMQIHGISNIQVKSFLGNFTDNGLLVKLGLEVKQIKANGEFKADVKFGGLRLAPKGPFNITLNNIRCIMLTDGEFVIKENGLRVELHRLNANVVVGDAKISANGIFSDRNLNNMILNLVNENLMEIIRVGVPATREQWAPILVEHINNYFSHIPLEKFLVQ